MQLIDHIPFINNIAYPVSVGIFLKRQNSYAFMEDKARRITNKKTGKMHYRLRKSKKNIRPARFDKMIQNPKQIVTEDEILSANQGIQLLLYAPAPDEYYQAEIIDSGIIVNNEDMKRWFAEDIQRKFNKKFMTEGFMRRNLPMVALAVIIFTLILAFLPVSMNFHNASLMMSQASSDIAKAVAEYLSVVGV